MSAFKIPSIFTAVDRVSSTVRRMASNVNDRMTAMHNKYGQLSDMTQQLALKSFALAAVIATPFILATREAIKFEDKMADVAKVMNLDAGSSQLKQISKEVKELSMYLGTLPDDTAELYSNIAQSGVAADKIGAVAKIAGEMGVAFGISADQAGESFVKLQNAMGITLDQTKEVTDAINHLGNNTAAASDQLLEFMAAGGAGAARNLGLLGEEAAAFGSVLIANGKSAAEAGTIFERTMKGILGNAQMLKIFKSAGGGLDGIMAVFEKGSKLKGDAQFNFFKAFGQYGTDISMLSKNFEQLQNTLGLVADKTNFANSSQAEFENRQRTTQAQLDKLKTSLIVAGIEIGEAILPVLNDILQGVIPVIKSFANWASENKELVKVIVIIAGVISGLLTILGTFATVVFTIISAKIAWSIAQTELNFALTANPIGIIIAVIGLLIAAIVWVISKTKNWGEQWDEVLDFMKAGFMLHWNILKIGFQGIVFAFTKMGYDLYSAWLWVQNKLGLISDEYYNSELERIDGIKQAQLDAMKETYQEMQKNMDRLGKGIEWKLEWDDSEEPESPTQTATMPGSNVPNPHLANANAMTQVIEKKETQKVELNIKTDNNTQTDVVKNTGNIPINLTPSFGGFKV